MKNSLEAFFKPRNIAIIGATPTKGKLGNVIFEVLRSKFKGNIYPINPKYRKIDDVECYPTVKDVPEDVDMAVIVVPAPTVLEVVKHCVDKGVKGVIIISSGFSEIGPEGAEREKKLIEIIEGTGTRIIGPNCLGVYDAYTGVDTWFLPEDRMARPPKGYIAIISQSGALAAAMLDWAARMGVGIAKAVSIGNKADVDEADLMEYLVEDPDVRVITIYLEGLRPGTGQKFVEVARKITKKKPVIVLKAGKTEKGTKAIASHTGSLAGAYQIYASAFKQAGIIEASSVLDLFDMARAFATQPIPRGRKVAVITNGGGMGVMATDALESLGLILPETPEDVKNRLRSKLVPFAALGNPIDVTGSVIDEHYVVAFEEVLKSDAFDMVMGIFLMQPPLLTEKLPDKIIEVLKKYRTKPVIAVSFGGSKLTLKLIKKLEEYGIPVYEIPERAARALWAMAYYSEIRELSK